MLSYHNNPKDFSQTFLPQSHPSLRTQQLFQKHIFEVITQTSNCQFKITLQFITTILRKIPIQKPHGNNHVFFQFTSKSKFRHFSSSEKGRKVTLKVEPTRISGPKQKRICQSTPWRRRWRAATPNRKSAQREQL